MIKINKALRLLVYLFIIININSCYVVDPPQSCSHFNITVSFISPIGVDLTGDSTKRYNRDSIQYYIQSTFDTTILANPTISKINSFNEYTITYNHGNAYGHYNLIFILNEVENDTININVLDGTHIEYFYKNSLIKKESGECGSLDYSIVKQ